MILIVEDERQVAASLERLFRFAGHEAVAVHDGMEALSLTQIRTPKLILVDLTMVPMDGLTFIRSIRADPVFSQVPIVVYTAAISQAAEVSARAAGVQDFIIKGTTGWESLVRRVEALLRPTEETTQR